MVHRTRVAIVTGGTGALGRSIVSHFLQEGVAVAVPYRDANKLGETRPPFDAPEERLLFHAAHLEKEDDVSRVLQSVVQRFGGIDYLVNAAGGYRGGTPVDQLSVQEWEEMVTMNLHTAFLVSRGALRMMKQAGFGRIVTIAALAGISPGSRRAAYAVSKAGAIALTKAIAEEGKGLGITANAIAPGTIRTEANLASMPGADTSTWVTPEEISRLVLFLCSDEARSITGNVLRITGEK